MKVRDLYLSTSFTLISLLVSLALKEASSTPLSEPYPFQTGSDDPVKDWKSLRRIFHKSNAHPATYLKTPEVIQLYGYPAESHVIRTEDGYYLTLHRIPHGKGRVTPKVNRPVAFLQHGLFASSFEWFMNTPDKLLALQLVDAGYDVWLGNARGNAYSRLHANLSTENMKFWGFSMHEMGKYDLPAAIDYVLNVTHEKQLNFIGFSMGTSTLWIMMSLRPEYNAKVKTSIALAPVAFINNMKGFPKLLAPFVRPLMNLLDVLFHGEFLPPLLLKIFVYIEAKLCSNRFIAETLCSNLIFLYAGWDLPQTQFNQLPLFYGHTPSPTSTRTLAHIAQLINTGIFQAYDFGLGKNLEKYGKPYPPEYSLKSTTVPTIILFGLNDAVISPIDVVRTAKELPNVIYNKAVNFTYWNHFDYHLGRDVNQYVNEPIMKLLARSLR